MLPLDTPLVSVVIPTFNVEMYIGDTISSVLAQSCRDLEVICVDDCSTDDTVKKIEAFKDSRVRLFRNSANLGAGETRNRGLAAATGRYVALLDSDDIWRPDKLSLQVALMQTCGSAAVFTKYDIINSDGIVIEEASSLPTTVNYSSLLRHCYIRTSTLMYDADRVGRDIKFESARKRQDYLFFLELLRRIESADLLPEVTCSYRLHNTSVSSRKLKNIPFQWDVYRKYEQMNLLNSMRHMANWFLKSGAIATRRRFRSALVRVRGRTKR